MPTRESSPDGNREEVNTTSDSIEKSMESSIDPTTTGIHGDPEQGLTKVESNAVVNSSGLDEKAEHDPNIVWWDGDDDPQNPMNWTQKKKYGHVAIISAITFVT